MAAVVEDRYLDLFKNEHVRPGVAPELLARLQVRYPNVPDRLRETRKPAEKWTYRFLAAGVRKPLPPED